ncbi:MAG: phage protein GemA/Gp16 family protein [Thermodesulfobacteriota bacterium]
MQITKDQIRKIWARGKESGMDEVKLYDLVEEVSGSRSISGLSKSQGIRVIDRLEGKESKKRKRRAPVPLRDPQIIAIATPAQLSLIEVLKDEAGWDDDHLMNFIRKNFKRDNKRKLRINEAGVVIEVLKKDIRKRREVPDVLP